MSSSNSILLQYDFSNASFSNGVLNDLSNNNLNANMSQYNYIGCYNDSSNGRAIPTQMPNVPNEQGCQQYAIQNNASIFGLQDYGQCFIGNNMTQATEYGPASNCPSMGGAWTNQVYSRSSNNPSLNQPGPTQILKSALFNVSEQQYITVPAFTTPTNGLSFSFWFISNNNGTWARIFDFGNGAESDNIIAYINNNEFGLSLYAGNTPAPNSQFDAIPNVNNNVWIHIVWTLDPSGVWNIYLNGNLYNIYPNVSYPRSISRNMNYIGKSNWSQNPYYNGNIADFRVFNGVLSASSVTNIYNAPNSNYWKYTPSIGNPIKLFQNNYITNWANLNITSNSNMSVSFIINIQSINSNWRNIFHITNNNLDCCNSGERVPGLWITDGVPTLTIINDLTGGPNNNFPTGNIPLNIPTRVDIIWNAENITIYFNEVLNMIHDYPSPLIPANPNAYVYIADPWYISSGYTIQDLTFYNGPSIAPPSSELEYNYLGCYNDSQSGRAIPTQLQNVSNPQECQELAISKNSALYGVQDGGQCFIGNDINQAIQYGQAANCPTMGGSWTNQLYSTVPIPKPTYNYVGCYNDSPSGRAIANEMNNVTSVYNCEQLAKENGYTVYGLQDGGQCFGSSDINAAREYGLQTNQSECTPLGGSWTNQVYTNIDNVPPLTNINPNMPATVDEYNYKGCYNNKDNTAIPTFRGNVTSMDQCAQLAINSQEYIFGVTNNGQCYTGNNIDQALGQGQDDATAYCGTLGSSNTYQVYIRNSTTNPIMEPAKLEDPNFYPYDPSYRDSGGGSGGDSKHKSWITRDLEAAEVFGKKVGGEIGGFFSRAGKDVGRFFTKDIGSVFRRRERFTNFNNNNSKYLYSLKILIIILIIILLIYMLYHMI